MLALVATFKSERNPEMKGSDSFDEYEDILDSTPGSVLIKNPENPEFTFDLGLSENPDNEEILNKMVEATEYFTGKVNCKINYISFSVE